MFPVPRDFQELAHSELRKGFAAGHRRQIVCSPTGSGKSYIGLRICNEAINRGKYAAFVCDRTALINQTSETADRYGIEHGIIQADHWRSNRNANLQICSVQTLARRKIPAFDVMVVDECHSQYDLITKFAEQNKKTAIIGLSATPFSKGLGRTYTNLVNAATMHELTQKGILVPMRVFSGVRPDMRGAKVVAGEWSDIEKERRGMEIIGDAVMEWTKHASGMKTIFFGSTIAHCKEICRQFNEAGVMAALYTSKTSDEERLEILDSFRGVDCPIRVLVSVEALAKGFDVADVQCVADARPMRKSLSTVIQMWGRGLRCSPETDKSECVLLDFSGNAIRFQEDFEEFYFNGIHSLDDGQKLDSVARKDDEEKAESACPKCGHKPFVKRCISCGYERQSSSMIDHLPGQLMEIKIGKAKAAESPEHLWAQIATYVRQKGKPETSYGRALHLYKDIVGAMPPRHFGLDVPDVDISKALIGKIRSRQIAWAKSPKRNAS